MAQRRLKGTGKTGLGQRIRTLNLGQRKAACVLIAAGSALALALGVGPCLRTPAFTVEKAETSEEAISASTDEASAASTDAAQDTAPAPLLVDIDGEVAHPGVYDLAGTTERVKDAVEAAGGLLDDADTAQLNLAQTVADGTKIHVPKEGESAAATATASQGTSSTAPSESSSASSAIASSSAGSGLVNINTATAEELETLPGVGESTAHAIIQDRTEHGAFSSKEDLMRVSGIGEKKYAKLEASICV